MHERDLLSAIPVAASHASLEALPGGGGVLTCRAPDGSGPGGWLARALSFQRQRRFQLDEVGACFWRQVDGQRRLSEIHDTLCSRYGLSSAQARGAIVEFTAALMRRNLLALRLGDA